MQAVRLPSFEYLRPGCVEEAVAALKEGGSSARLLSGGTDLLVGMKQRLYSPRLVIDLNSLNELSFIRAGNGEEEAAGEDDWEGKWSGKGSGPIRVGGGVILADLVRNPLIRAFFPTVAEAATCVGGVQQQEMGTVAGNLCLDTRCWYFNQSASWRRSNPPCFKTGGDECHAVPKSRRCHASYCGDLGAVLMALDAGIRLTGPNGSRELPLSGFYHDDGLKPTHIRPDELLKEVLIPTSGTGWRAGYRKFRLRNSLEFPLAGAAVAVREEAGFLADVRVVLNAVAPAPFRASEAENLLRGAAVEDISSDGLPEQAAFLAAKAARPVRNTVCSAGYRKHMVGVLVEEVLVGLFAN